MNIKTIALLNLLSLFAAVCSAQETRPSAIFDQVLAQYQSMTAYSSEGTITADIDTGGGKTTMETTFSIKLKKPNQYLITWNQTTQNIPFAQSGAVWSDGSQPYLYMGVMKAYSKMSGDEMALGAATGISGGAAFTIPSLFLPVFKSQPDPFSRLINPQIEGGELVDGDDCYIISGSSTVSKKETFWISKTAHLIRKYSRSLEAPEGGVKLPQMTDQQLDESIKAMGQQVTDATRQQMRDSMKKAQESLKTANLKGSSTEVHLKINSPDLKDSDFDFKPPAEATLKDSLFGGMMNAK
jgi:outer membrane lipoprotein-sorting protein